MTIGRVILLILVCSNLALAEGVPFKVSSSSLAPNTQAAGQSVDNADPESTLINDLKYLAVSNWLQSYLGPRYTQFDKHVTPEFAEKYILDYKVARTGSPAGSLDLIGHLDGEALKRWVHLFDSKSKASNQIKPLFILSSNLPGLNISPAETATRQKDSAIAQLLFHLTQIQFKKLNSQLIPLENSIGLDSPPKNTSEIQSLTSSASRKGDSLVVWEAISVCPGCTTARLDIFTYNTQNQSLAFVVGDDLSIPLKDLTNGELLKKALLPIFQQFQSDLENIFSEDSLQESSFRIVFENIDSYRILKAAEVEMGRGNGFSAPVFKKASNKSAEYELKSALSVEELATRIQAVSLPGLRTQVSKADSSTLIVKFTK